MRKVPLQDVEDGMILSEPLTGASGNVLMGKGIPLRASIIPRLQAWGVTHVCIEGDPSPEELAQSPSDMEFIATLERLFIGKGNSIPMQTIYQSLLKHRERNVHR
jgi:hypothetical protein